MSRNRVRSRARALSIFSDSAISLDFIPIAGISPSLDPRITFTRSTIGTYVNSAGVLTSAAINEPRFDHDPITFAPKGLLIEEQRTNLLLNSATLNTQNVTVTAASHTLSFTGTGTITLSGASTSGPLVGIGNSEGNRVSLTFTPTAGALTLTVSGTVSNAQLELGSFRTSYIPTTISTATRAADLASMTGANFSSWYNQTEGTIYLKAQCLTAITSQTYVAIDNGTSNNLIIIRTSPSSATFDRSQVNNGGVTQAALGAGGYAATSINNFAFAYKTNNFSRSINGSAVATDTSGTVPSVNQMFIGSERGQSFINGHMRSIVYYPTRISNEKLRALTS